MDARSVLCCLPAASLLLLLVATATADAKAVSCRVEECPNFRAIRYHEELGCVRADGSSECCPTHFDCSSLLSADKKKCHYKGRTYEPGAETGDEVSRCVPSCTCRADEDGTYGGEATFICPGTDCALFGIPPEQQSECYVTDSLDAYCPTGVRCVNDTDTRRNLAQCPYKGKTYWEDERIQGTYSECKTCVCQKGFDGTLDGPWCKRNSCWYALYRRISELGKCAPIFRADDNCCASRFHCPSADDSVVRHSESTTVNEGGQCSFGEHSLSVGDELVVGSNGCVKCRCDVPPFMTCTQKAVPECEVYSFG